jgi:pimeloyl-ACP methyl ester carboxylesterase
MGRPLAQGGLPHRAREDMSTFVIAHGAWSAGWAWKKMHTLLDVNGDRLFTPTYTGLGERAHLASPSNDLETHIQDVLGVLEYEDLRDVVLIGHSYGGMVATGVADRARDRIKHLVYLDAFVPRDGQSQVDLLPAERGARMRRDAERRGDGWRVPPNPTPPDTSPIDEAWIAARRQPQSIACFEMPLRLRNGELTVPLPLSIALGPCQGMCSVNSQNGLSVKAGATTRLRQATAPM